MPRLRVLNSITGLNFGGAELMLARYLRGLRAESSIEPSVLSLMTPGPVGDRIAAMGVDIRTLAMREARPRLGALAGLRRACSSTDPVLLHGWMYHGNLAASIAAMVHRRQPVIWSVHHSLDDIDTEKPMTRWLIRLSARLSARTAAISYCSRVSADQHERLGFDVSKRRVIPNGIDCSEFRPDARAGALLRRELGIPAKRLLVGNVARAHPMKDHGGFVRMIGHLLARGFDVQGVIVGAGHEAGVARGVAAELGISERITTAGPRDDMPAVVAGFDLYALSSAWGEAFPLSVAEAMACGVPAIVTDVGDCGWLVGAGELVTPPRTPAAQAEAAARLLALSATARRQVGAHARRRIVEKFSLENYVRLHLDIYDEALAAHAFREAVA